MLRGAVASFLDAVSEREFDAPLMAILASRGFVDIKFRHGSAEYGKDFVAKGWWTPNPQPGGDPEPEPIWTQFAVQSKAGDLNLGAWRDVRQQLDEARLDDLGGPDFDASLPRVAILVLTGRLTGNAPTQAESYRQRELRSGRPDFAIWDRETLLEMIVDDPEVGLAGTSDGPLLRVIGLASSPQISVPVLEVFSRRWLPPVPGSPTAAVKDGEEEQRDRRRSSLEAVVLAQRLQSANRTDLAAYVSLMLLRSEWCHVLSRGGSEKDSTPALSTARLSFANYAMTLLSDVEDIAANAAEFLRSTCRTPLPHVVYPVICARTVEILGLLGLLSRASDLEVDVPSDVVDRAAATVRQLVASQPGANNIVSDSFACSLIAPSILLSDSVAELQDFLTSAAQWVADRYDDEYDGIGLAPPNSTASDEMASLLSGIYDMGPLKRTNSYAATVILDLAALFLDREIYLTFLNDFLAVDATPELLSADERVSQWRPQGPHTTLNPNVAYSEELTSTVVAPHFRTTDVPIPSWDAVALHSVVRDRHSISAIRSLSIGGTSTAS